MDLHLFVRSPFELVVVEGIAFLGVVRIIRVADELFIGYLGVTFFCCSCNSSSIILVAAVQEITLRTEVMRSSWVQILTQRYSDLE